MSECENCHGTGKVTCSKCGGDKEVKCERCNGRGTFRNCSKCDSTGKIDCPSCDGSGEEFSICPVCDYGKVEKTRWINCASCHGSGRRPGRGLSRGEIVSCWDCNGRGQVKERYTEICPNCHGEYRRKTDKKCNVCGGTGKTECSRCEGTGKARCQECGASGKVECDVCHGEGMIKCPDCEKREKERKRKEEQEARKKEQARQRAKKRRERLGGFLWRVAVALSTGFVAWWWLEGSSAEALLGMLDQLKGLSGDISPNLKMAAMVSGGMFMVLCLLWVFGVERIIRFLAVLIGCVPIAISFINGHWGVGSVMALALIAVVVAIFKHKVRERLLRWIVMALGLAVSGGLGMDNCWPQSIVFYLVSVVIVIRRG